ncbi:MAG: CBS domain-containing protein [Desulfobacteraceae bacterium]|nr:CBS domain-containing protein [Desulfobacteraceae bacterium]
MIPINMDAYLRDKLPETVIQKRLLGENGMCFLELGPSDRHLLSRLGITPDKLGPKLVACVWNETSELEIGGYVVVDNLSMGSPSMGGIRMLPTITPVDIHNLARGMTLKNGAANLPYGGGKSGIVAPEGGISPENRREIIRGWARLIRRYRDIYVPGPDVGTNDNDMKTIAIENGLDSAVSKPADMGGNRIDELGGAAGGVVIALQTLLEIMPRLRVLPQFSNLQIPEGRDLKVLIQGFGAVGAHAARIMGDRLPDAKITGISDFEGYLFDENGLPVDELYTAWKEKGLVTIDFYNKNIAALGHDAHTYFSTQANNLLRESAFCLIPAAAVFNYLGVLPNEKASMSVENMGDWRVVVEGANTYSPDPNKKASRTRMEQIVYREKGVMIANDYMVNSGGVIFAAQEHVVRTPDHLQIPREMLGDREAVDGWLKSHASDFAELSKQRLEAGDAYREKVIRRNMIEMVDHLAADVNLLPSGAAERISLQRLTAREQQRTASDIMVPMQTAKAGDTLQEAAAVLVQETYNMIAVLDAEGKLAGVLTAWDIAKAVAEGGYEGSTLESIMTGDFIAVAPDDSVYDVLRDLEQHRISAMPVVDEEGAVLGLVNSDLLAHRYLKQFFQSQDDN